MPNEGLILPFFKFSYYFFNKVFDGDDADSVPAAVGDDSQLFVGTL
jgi:hypothetical protein